ncbi:MAG: alpha-amylase family glycosyl hydrolase [Chitinophagales bacterium]|nr:alpha-amylase family glycosyl hydrolase [Chitinophagales bacterium]MDW8272997.1 alpha-amylase family glycosyl hydrolase [Chitinophagales bacterium]
MRNKFNPIFLLLFITHSTCFAQPWYHHTTVYQVYPRSFYDSNGDGIGDIKGIISKLDYIQSLGFETIWCSPFFSSPQKDFGYDISDYLNIAPEYGTLNDIEDLINEVHRRGMKIVFDLVMNHTSDEHEWFKKDIERKNDKDFYVWLDKPNNWKNMLGKKGWHFSPERKQYYWASFLKFQPDLNYRNPEVKAKMFDVVRYWLSKGIDGFRLDIFGSIFEDSLFRNNPHSCRLISSDANTERFFQKPQYTLNLPESIQFAKELRKVTDEFGNKMLLGEVTGDRKTIRSFLGEDKNDGLGLVFNFEMLRFKFSAKYFRNLIANIEKDFAAPYMPVYVFSNHDRRRSLTRLNKDITKAELLHTLQLTVRGVPCVYYGEEIGMTDVRMPYRKALDPIPHLYKHMPRFIIDWGGETLNRDEVRTPMQWDTSVNAGFSSAAHTWLPVGKNYRSVNVMAQSADSSSLFNTFKKLLELRKKYNALKRGSMEILDDKQYSSNKLLAYKRTFEDEKILVLLYFGRKKFKIPISQNHEVLFTGNAKIENENTICFENYGSAVIKLK